MFDRSVKKFDDVIICDVCLVLCCIRFGCIGVCDRYGNTDGVLVCLDLFVVI